MAKRKTSSHEFLSQLDRLPSRERSFERIIGTFDKLAEFYGFGKIYTPILESGHVISPLIKGGFLAERPPVFCKTNAAVDVFLRPTALISVLRAYTAHKMSDLSHPLKLFFEGESFFAAPERRPSRILGRCEWGLVMIGEGGAVAEAEIVQIIRKALEEVGIDPAGIELRINATGCNECRSHFRSSFCSYFRTRADRLCKKCKRDLKYSPTKILHCEEEKCKMATEHAPQILDFLCGSCKKHMKGFLEFLDEIRVPYFLDSCLFKEGSWYSTIVFEMRKGEDFSDAREHVLEEKPAAEESKKEVGSHLLLAEGGRISRMAEVVTGRRLEVASGIVFLDNIKKLLAPRENSQQKTDRPKVFLVQLGELAKRKSLVLIEELRRGEIGVAESLGRDSVKAQLGVAERSGAQIALILGHKEALDEMIIVREIDSGMQETIPQEKLIDFLRKKLKK